MRAFLATSLLILALPLTACNFYFDGGDDPDPCDYGGSSSGSAPSDGLQQSQLLRDPYSGTCQDFGGGYPGPCDSECGPCLYPAGDQEAPGQAMPSWGYCESYCTGLDQDSCLATDGCRGIFANGGLENGTFQECWQTDQAGPGLIETCDGLDAYACSRQDNCIAQHEFPCGGFGDPVPGGGAEAPACDAGNFVACHNESGVDPTGCYGNQDCGTGFECNADTICLPPPGNGDCDPSSGGCGVPAVCYGYCIAITDPGECDGEVLCDLMTPVCAAGTTPGIANGCYTGLCIDLDLCPKTECAQISGESMCVARPDCDAFYVGVDCTCDPSGCDCASWDYDSCSSI